ncbi:unnamed protein product [Phytophthora fragariaefolia]|uniref:Unnamed protein product n=1 Tax=Phytophthora fragariaefolia TaxID=1490495 RepID=A0A9W6XWL0_9STRA|nr:unnamed protein product [Phytophthora fragariaefolia]
MPKGLKHMRVKDLKLILDGILEFDILSEMEYDGVSREVKSILLNNRFDDHATLSECGLHDGDTLNLMTRLVGGFVPTRRFADVSDESILVMENFSPNASRWRTAGKGLNIEGICESQTCAAFGQRIIHPAYYTPFNLLKDNTAKCPICGTRVKPFTCGFYDCVWKFEGVKASDGLSIISPWKNASGHKYHCFDVAEKIGCVEG